VHGSSVRISHHRSSSSEGWRDTFSVQCLVFTFMVGVYSVYVYGRAHGLGLEGNLRERVEQAGLVADQHLLGDLGFRVWG
jgi:hypothetical protein